jgi:hypothetical protein
MKKKKEVKISTQKLNGLLKASYQNNKDAAKTADENGYKLDHQLSNRKQKVYIDGRGNPTIAYTGTRTLGDVITDGALAVGLGRFTNRFNDSKKLVNTVKEKYKNKFVTTTGDSLGGSLAEHSGGDKVITHNKGVGIGGLLKKIPDKQIDIRAGGDLVSALSTTQSGGKRITIPKTNYLNPLQSHDYNNLHKIDRKL